MQKPFSLEKFMPLYLGLEHKLLNMNLYLADSTLINFTFLIAFIRKVILETLQSIEHKY